MGGEAELDRDAATQRYLALVPLYQSSVQRTSGGGVFDASLHERALQSLARMRDALKPPPKPSGKAASRLPSPHEPDEEPDRARQFQDELRAFGKLLTRSTKR